MKPVGLSPEAVVELTQAASWYETRQPGLAIRFLQEIEQARQAIQSRPLSFPRLANIADDLTVRRALLPRFPYALVFLELPTEIHVLAVAHAKRHPDYWLNRVQTT
ncbi:MAG: type II toxin-antitoxin system RelE/ParE family toxin [Nitrospirae bacterium]|nr:type II toxin-antitoxin system RelE/ParE family toxin [Nitrospirota bacterium]MDE3219691.1 type II toxin-antitoxin system RelE/ParE family toxin [Nitrospirota bacterium]